MNGFHFLMRKMKNSFEKVPFLLVPPNALGVWPPMPWGKENEQTFNGNDLTSI